MTYNKTEIMNRAWEMSRTATKGTLALIEWKIERGQEKSAFGFFLKRAWAAEKVEAVRRHREELDAKARAEVEAFRNSFATVQEWDLYCLNCKDYHTAEDRAEVARLEAEIAALQDDTTDTVAVAAVEVADTTTATADIITTKVAGVTYEGRQALLERLTAYTADEIDITLQRESGNEYDRNAVAVIAGVRGRGSAVIGYLPRQVAAFVAVLIDRGQAVIGKFVEVRGKYQAWHSYGCEIQLSV
jgi:hypothetical protein